LWGFSPPHFGPPQTCGLLYGRAKTSYTAGTLGDIFPEIFWKIMSPNLKRFGCMEAIMAKKNLWIKILIITNVITICCFGYTAIHDKVPQRLLNKLGITKFETQTKQYVNYRIEALHSLGSDKEGFEIVMLGDSITKGGNWEELLKGYDVANYGIGGDTTTGILYRLPDVYMAHPKKVFLMIGTNDIALYHLRAYDNNNVETIFENYKKIIDALHENGIEVIVQSTLNVTDEHVERPNNEINTLNQLLQVYCLKQNIKYLDINSVVSNKGVLNGQYTSDGLHLNKKGYNNWKGLIIKELENN
jgi:lysophospholipase L1-like esterase